MKAQTQRRIGIERYPMLEQLIREGKTMPELSVILDVSQEHIRRWAKRRDIQITPHEQKMEAHPSWNGGVIESRGYFLRRVRLDGEFGYLIRSKKRSGKPVEYGYALVHRIVMHEQLGRKLMPGEVVDHIDGNTKNNQPSNLRLFVSNAEHLRVTLKGRVPKWTPEGWKNMCAPRPNYQRKASQP